MSSRHSITNKAGKSQAADIMPVCLHQNHSITYLNQGAQDERMNGIGNPTTRQHAALRHRQRFSPPTTFNPQPSTYNLQLKNNNLKVKSVNSTTLIRLVVDSLIRLVVKPTTFNQQPTTNNFSLLSHLSYILVLLLLTISTTGWGQTQIYDDFTGYTTGSLGTQGGWANSGTGPDLTVTAPGTALTYSGYNGGGGNYIVAGTPSSTAKAYSKTFASGTLLGTNTFYYSLLLKVTSCTTTGQYIFAINDGGTAYVARLWTKLTATPGVYNLGVSTQAAAVYGTTNLNVNQTYLVVVSYESISGASNDIAKIWINPSLSSNLIGNVAPEATQTSGGDPANNTYDRIIWRNQSVNTAAIQFDAIRLAYGTTSANAWSNLAAATTSTLAAYGTQLSGNVLKAATNVPLAGFTVTPPTQGADFTALTVTGATSTSSDVSNVRIFRDFNGDGIINTTGGTDAVVSGTGVSFGTTMSFTISGETGFTAARNYIIVGDIASGATAASVGVSIGSAAFTTSAPLNTGSMASVSRTIASQSTPTTTSISPTSATAGGAGFTLTVNGTNFVSGLSTVTWGGSNRTTTFVSSTQLTATISASDIASANTVNVGVTTSGAASASGTQLFTINSSGNATPPSLSPANSPTVDGAFDITFTNDGTWAGVVSSISVNGVSLTAGYTVSADRITFTPSLSAPASALQIPGNKNIVISSNGYTNATITQSIGVGAINKLQLLMPGETAAPATGTGKTGAASAQTAGSSFSVTVNSVDQYWNVVNSNRTIAITSSDANAILPPNADLSAGTATFSVTLVTAGASRTVTATDQSVTPITASTGAAVTLNAGAFAKMQTLVPGETAAPGTATGKTGTPSAQTAGTGFTVTVNAVDANWNVVSTALANNIAISTSDPNDTHPATNTLSSGTRTFTVTFTTAGSWTVTATNSTDGSKTASTSPSITAGVGAFAKMQILVPGETAAPGTSTGKTGTPSAQTAGTGFTVTVNAVDANWNVVSSAPTNTIAITTSDANDTHPANASLASGTQTFTVTLTTAGTSTVTATNSTDGTKTASTSPSITVNAGAFSKMQIIVPGETAVPGSSTGKTGTPTSQFSGAAFSVTVNAVDANWNLISSAPANTIAITSSDGTATLPSSAQLSGGTVSFNVTLNTAGTATVTATNSTDNTKTANSSPSITVTSPLFYQSNGSGNWGTASIWQTSTNGSTGWTTATLAPTATNANTITIRTGNNVTVAASVTADQIVIAGTGTLTISASQTLTLNDGMGTDLDVGGTGTVSNAGTITLSGSATIAYGSGTTYTHNQDGGTVPAATWNTNSTCTYTSTAATPALPAGLTQSFGNFTWNCTSQASGNGVHLNNTLQTINGNFTVTTGGGLVRLNDASDGSSTLTIGGNLIISASSGMNINFGTGNTTSGGTGTLNISGNISIATSGVLTQSSRSGKAVINLNGNTNKTFSFSGTAFNSTNNPIDINLNAGTLTLLSNLTMNQFASSASYAPTFTVANGATLDLGTFSILNAGSSATNFTNQVAPNFILNSGATLVTANTSGVNATATSGAIQVTGSRTFSGGANYTFNGSGAQAIGDALDGTSGSGKTGAVTGNIIISNTNTASGVTLNAGTTITVNTPGSFNVGVANTSSSILTAPVTSIINGTGSFRLLGNGATSGSTLITANASGVDGTIQVSGTEDLTNGGNNNTNFTFNGTALAQITGTTMPATINNLTINNATAGTATATPAVLLSQSTTVNGTMTFTAGHFSINGKSLTLNGPITITSATRLVGTPSSNLTIGGSGTIGATGLFGTSGGGALNDFTLNRSGQTLSVGTSLTVSGAFSLTNGVLSSGGTLTLNGNISFGSGTLTGGSQPLVIGGSGTITGNLTATSTPLALSSLTMNRANSTLNLGSNVTVSNTTGLTLNAGYINLGSFNLTSINSVANGNLGAGSPTSHIVATGSGQAFNTFAGGASSAKTFPIGDGTNYTPVSLTFSANSVQGTVGVKTVASAHPAMGTQTNSLARYWSFTTTSLTTYTYSGTFGYVAGDVTGSETLLRLQRYNGSSWAAYLTSSASGNVLSSPGGLTNSTAPLNASDFTGFSSALNYVWNGSISNDWTEPNNWTPNGVPTAQDNVTINVPGSFTNCSVNAGSITIASVNLNGTGALNIAAGATLSVNGTLVYDGSSGATATFAPTSTVAFSSVSSQNVPAFSYGNLNLTGGDRTLANTGTIGIAGTYTPGSGTFTVTGSTVNFNGTGTQTVPASTFANLTISTPTANAGGAITVGGTLTIPSGSNFNMSTFALNGSSLTTSGTGILQTANTGSTPMPTGRTWSMDVLYNSASGQTVVAGTYANLNISGGARTLINGGTINISGTYTPGSGTLTVTGNTINFNGANGQTIPAAVYNTLTSTNNTRTLSSTGTIEIRGDFTPGISNYTVTGSTVTIAGSAAQSITIPAVASGNNFNILTINRTGTTSATAATLVAPATTTTIRIGTINIDAGYIILNATTTAQTFIVGTWSQTGGTLDNNSTTGTGLISTLQVSGNYSQSGGVHTTSGSGVTLLQFNGGSTSTFTGTTTAANFIWTRIQISSNTTLNVSTNNLLVNYNPSTTVNAIIIDAGSTLNLGSLQLLVSNSNNIVTVNGTIQTANANGFSGSTATAISSTNSPTITLGTNSTVEYTASSGSQIITGRTDYQNLTISGAANKTLGGTTSVAGTLTFASTGDIITGNNTITANGSVARPGGGYVIGNLRKPAAVGTNLSITFEIGDAASYTPITVSFASVTVQGNLTASTSVPGTPPSSASGLSQTQYADRYWVLSNSNIQFTSYNATLNFVSGDIRGNATPTNFSAALNENNAGVWSYPSVQNNGSTFIQLTGITVFGGFCVGETCNTPDALAFVAQPVSILQDATMGSVTVRAYCSSNGATATRYNQNITLTATNGGCGYAAQSAFSQTVAAVNGVATFNNIKFTRSPQTNITLTASAANLSDIVSNTFSVTAPIGSSTIVARQDFGTNNTLSYATNIGGLGVFNTSNNRGVNSSNCLAFYYDDCLKNTSGSSSTAIFAQSSGFTGLNNVRLNFSMAWSGSQLAGASCSVGTGATGLDKDDFIRLEVSVNGGSYVTTFQLNGYADMQYPFSSSSVSLNYDANQTLSATTKPSAFTVNLPEGTNSVNFRFTFKTNRRSEVILIDDLIITGIPAGVPSPLPIANAGLNKNGCNGGPNQLQGSATNTVGVVSYSWSPTSSLLNPASSNPVASNTTTTIYTLTVTDADNCKATSTVTINILNGTPGVWTGTENTDWFNCQNWASGSIPTTETDVQIKDVTNDPEIGAGTANCRNITFDANTYLTMSDANAQLNVYGNYNNAGLLIPGDGLIAFRGNSNQSITTSAVKEVFNSMTVNKTGGNVVLNKPLDVNGVLTLNSGLINTTTTNLLTLTSSASYTGGSNTSFVNGPMRKIGNTNFTFPVGKPLVPNSNNSTGFSSGYRPIAIANLGANASSEYTAEFFDQNSYQQIGTIAASISSTVKGVNPCEYWGLRRGAAAQTNITVSLNWTQNTDCNIAFNITNPARIIGVLSTKGIPTSTNNLQKWDLFGGTASSSLTNPPYTSGLVTWSGIDIDGVYSNRNNPSYISARITAPDDYADFIPFTIATTNTTEAPLPLKLLYFRAAAKEDKVLLSWQVADNHEALSYVLERSRNGVQFEHLKTVAPIPNEELASYQSYDEQPWQGINYYRLRITDIFGKVIYSSIQKVNIEHAQAVSLRISPNPAKNRLLILLSQPEKINELNIVNSVGQTLFKQSKLQSTNPVDISSLRPGIYYVRIIGQSGMQMESFVKE